VQIHELRQLLHRRLCDRRSHAEHIIELLTGFSGQPSVVRASRGLLRQAGPIDDDLCGD